MTREEAIFIAKNPVNQHDIKRAIEHESQVQFYSEFALSEKDAGSYKSTFFKTVKQKLNSDHAYSNFVNNITFPLKTNEFIDSIYKEMSRVFNGTDKYIDFEFSNPDLKADAANYINIKWFNDEGFDIFKSNPNTIIVTDMQAEIPQNDLPEPYFYPLYIENVIDVVSVNNEIQYVLYWVCEDKKKYVVAIDNINYLVLDTNNEANDPDKWVEVSSAIHTLGRTPATWLCNINLYSNSDIVKATYISWSLGDLFELLKMYTDKNTVDNHMVPFIVKYGDDGCDYDNGVHICNNGVLWGKSDNGEEIPIFDFETNKLKKCPKCNRQTGAGEIIKLPPPLSKEDVDLNENAIKFVSPELSLFDVFDKRVQALEDKVINRIIGQSFEMTSQAINELQVSSNFENKTQTLRMWAKPWEFVTKHTNDNILMLRYQDQFLGSAYDLGSNFYNETVEDILNEKKQANELGLDNVIDYDRRVLTKRYENNPSALKRSLYTLDLSKNLRVYNDLSTEQVINLYSSNNIEFHEFVLNTEFYNFISRFEQDNNLNITDLEFNQLLIKFNDSINKYLEEYEKPGQ